MTASKDRSTEQTTVLVHAAGSLSGALTEMSNAFEASSGTTVHVTYGPSGLLHDEITSGARTELFASANMTLPQTLARAGKAGPVTMFARNKLCALVRSGLAVTPETLLDYMLDPAVKLATSTPKVDPSGDYAFECFAMAEKIRSGAQAALEKKALQLTGGPNSPPPKERSVYGTLIAGGHADIFLTYRTNAMVARRENSDQQIVALPDNLAVGADFGFALIIGASSGAGEFAAFIMSAEGQKILASHGFAPPARAHSVV